MIKIKGQMIKLHQVFYKEASRPVWINARCISSVALVSLGGDRFCTYAEVTTDKATFVVKESQDDVIDATDQVKEPTPF